MVMNDNAMDILLSGTARAGKEISIATGSAADAGADILQFPVMSMAEPDTLTVKGATISVLKKWNQEYYGRIVSVADILVDHQVQKAGADSLRRAIAGTLSR
jgi:lipid-binding SYLF domain-containing protein